jgi:hypothetical protein
MAQGTGEIREEIEATRTRVGEEVEALSYKTDVGARVDDYVDEKKQAVVSKVAGAKDAVTGAVTTVAPSKRQVQGTARSAGRLARQNPLGLAVAGAAAGFLAGFLLPSTRVEDEHLGEASERVKETAAEAGQQALERGKDVAQSALESAREEGEQQTRELATDLKDRVQNESPSTQTTTARTS